MQAQTSAKKAQKAQEAALSTMKLHGVDAKKFGKVPWYLVTRNAELEKQRQEEEDARAARAQKGALLSDAERLGMLAQLKKTFASKSVALQRMPIIVETYSLKKQKAQLERDLDELEKGIRRFSNPKVYVSR